MAFTGNDMLEIKKRELDSYKRQFDDAVGVITDTIARLEFINERADQKIQEISEYQAQLEATKTGLSDTKTKNTRIIKNFKALLGE